MSRINKDNNATTSIYSIVEAAGIMLIDKRLED